MFPMGGNNGVDLEVTSRSEMMPLLGDCHEINQRFIPFSRYHSMWMSGRGQPKSGTEHGVSLIEPIDTRQQLGHLEHSLNGLSE